MSKPPDLIRGTLEISHDARPIRWAQEFVRDLRYAQRSLRRAAAFTVVAVATLALGIGANTAMFSVLHTYLFRALPYPQPEQLVELYRTASWNQFLPYSPPNFLDQREKNTVFASMAAFSPSRPSLALEGESAERLEGLAVSSDFFPALGVHAALGRVFTPNEDQPGANRVMVLSDRFWQSRFGGDPNIVGRALRVDGEPVTVVGVMPAGFDHPLLWGTVDLWRPIAFTPEQRQSRNNNYLRVIARTKPGVSLPQASEAMVTLAASIAKQTALNQNDSLRLAPLRQSIRLSRGSPTNPNWLQVVGIVNDVEFPGSLRPPRTLLQVFRPLPQAPVLGVNMLLRGSIANERSADLLRRAVAELDPAQPLHRIRTARSLVDSGLGSISLLGTLLGAFAALGLTLAAIGIYGVTSYSVVQRTSEFGIRMALGAQRRDVLWLVMANGARLIVMGTLIGVAGAYAVSRLLIATIPTLPTRDPAALAGMTIALVAVALAACYLPAGRAARVDPLVALRHD